MQKEEISYKLGELSEKIDNLKVLMSNHLVHDHKKANIVSWIQTLIIVILFSFLKWGKL